VKHFYGLVFSGLMTGVLGCGVEQAEPPPTEARGPVISGEQDVLADGFQADTSGFVATSAGTALRVDAGSLHVSGRTGALAFTTTSVARGGDALALALRGTAVDEVGSVRIDRSGVTEILAPVLAGVEQSWEFAATPEGDGDLVVRVRVDGHTAVERAGGGLSFAVTTERFGQTAEPPGHSYGGSGSAVAERFSYSPATWIDATGRRTALAVAWHDDAIEIRVPADVVDTSAYPAVLDPTIGAENTVEAQIPGFSGGRAREPGIAASNSRYLAVWRDDRTGGGSDIFATRVNTDGSIFDPKGFPVASTPAIEGSPVVVTIGGGDWLVAWTVNDVDVAAATVSSNGIVTQLGTIAGTAAAERNIALASDGPAAFLVWQADNDIRAARYGAGGFTAAFDVAVTAATEAFPTVTGSNGGDFLVAWEEGDTAQDIRGQRLLRAGGLSGAAFDVSLDTGVQTLPAAAFDGTNFVLAWKSRSDVWGARIDAAGTVLDTTGGTIGGVAIRTTAAFVTNPAVGCEAVGCLFTWEERTDAVNLTTGILAQRRALDFSVSGGLITVNDGDRSQSNPAITPRFGGGQVVIWDDRLTGIHNVHLARIAANGTVTDATPILVNTSFHNSHRGSAYAVSPGGQLAVWSDSRVLGPDIYARRYSATGVKLDGTATGGRVVSNAANLQDAPDLDFDGTQYVVAWADARGTTFDIYATRFTNAGVNLDPAGIALSTLARNQLAPAVASGPGHTLVVWGDESNTANRSDIVGAVVAPNGTFTSIDICRTAGDQQAATVVWDATNAVYVVAWEDLGGADADVVATRVQSDGTVLDGCGVSLSAAAGDQKHVALAPSGTQILAAWTDYRTDVNGDIYAARLTAAGAITVLDAAGIPVATGAQAQNTAAVGGLSVGRWSLAWEDHLNAATEGSNIVGNELSSAGALLGPQYNISATTDWETGPSFQNGTNTTRVTYLMYQRAIPVGAMKAIRRKLTHPVVP
jgi:hypothetical protein